MHTKTKAITTEINNQIEDKSRAEDPTEINENEIIPNPLHGGDTLFINPPPNSTYTRPGSTVDVAHPTAQVPDYTP
jgi:hypothetical protein